MDDLLRQIEGEQKAICQHYKAEYISSPGESKTGFALTTEGKAPVNGLRHPPQHGTSGWYIWCGEEYSEAADFFAPLHTHHLYDKHPEIRRLLGLPPGYRFLLAGNHLDVWYDESLLNV